MKLTAFIVILLAGVCTGQSTQPATNPSTRPTTQPAKKITELRSVLNQTPSNLRPRSGDSWTNAGVAIWNKWLNETFAEVPCSFSVEFTTANVRKDDFDIQTTLPGFKFAGLTFEVSQIRAVGAIQNSPKLNRFQPGDRVTITGKIASITIGYNEETKNLISSELRVMVKDAALK